MNTFFTKDISWSCGECSWNFWWLSHCWISTQVVDITVLCHYLPLSSVPTYFVKNFYMIKSFKKEIEHIFRLQEYLDICLFSFLCSFLKKKLISWSIFLWWYLSSRIFRGWRYHLVCHPFFKNPSAFCNWKEPPFELFTNFTGNTSEVCVRKMA